MVRMVHRHYPQLPRALVGRLRMCREAGGGAALHAGGWTVAGTRAWGACVTYQESRAVEARFCCEYPEDGGIRQELHDTCRERACLIYLSFAKCIGNTLESLMLASRIVAQRVRPAIHIAARDIKGLRVAHVWRTGAGLPSPHRWTTAELWEVGSGWPRRARDTHAGVSCTVPRCACRTPCASQRSLALPCVSGTCGSRRMCRLRCASRRPATSPAHAAPVETCVAGAWTLGRYAPRRALERST
jgi:hypothetical protein